MDTETDIIVDVVRKTRTKTIEILHAVPDGILDKTHPPYDRTFMYTFSHIAEGVEGWLHGAFQDSGPGPTFVRWDVHTDRMAILEALERSQKRMIDWLKAHPDLLTQPLGGGARGASVLDRVIYLIGHEVNHQTQILDGLHRHGLDWDIFLPY